MGSPKRKAWLEACAASQLNPRIHRTGARIGNAAPTNLNRIIAGIKRQSSARKTYGDYRPQAPHAGKMPRALFLFYQLFLTHLFLNLLFWYVALLRFFERSFLFVGI